MPAEERSVKGEGRRGGGLKTTLNRHFLLCVEFIFSPSLSGSSPRLTQFAAQLTQKTKQNKTHSSHSALVADTNALPLPLQLADTFHLQLLCLLLLQLPGFTFRHVRNAVCHSAGQANVNKSAACLARE